MTVSWSAGPHHGLVWPVPDGLGAAIVDGEVDGADVTSLWTALDGVADLWSFVETMWRVVGVGLAGMPPFAVILPGDDGVIVAARGPFLVRADDGETTRTFTGHDVSTWCEGHVPRPATIVAEMTGPASPGGPPPRPLTGGVVPVRSMRMEVAVAAAGTIPPPTGAPASTPPATSRHEDVGLGVPPAAAPRVLAPEVGPTPDRAPPGRPAAAPSDAGPDLDPDPTTGLPPSPAVDAPESPSSAPTSGSRFAGLWAREDRLPEPPDAPDAGADTAPHPPPDADLGSVEPSADDDGELPVTQAVPVAPAFAESAPPAGDHDGQTILGRRTDDDSWLVRSSDGDVVRLSGTLVVGRDPDVGRVDGPLPVHALRLPHPHVSGSHLALSGDGVAVLVRDLGSTNGTTLRRAGGGSEPIEHVPVTVVGGDVIDLGRGVSVTVERA